jgi:hypothetical protein
MMGAHSWSMLRGCTRCIGERVSLLPRWWAPWPVVAYSPRPSPATALVVGCSSRAWLAVHVSRHIPIRMAIRMVRLVALVALALLVGVSAGPAAAVQQPLAEGGFWVVPVADYMQLFVLWSSAVARKATLAAAQGRFGGGFGWLSWPQLEAWNPGYVDGEPRHLLRSICSSPFASPFAIFLRAFFEFYPDVRVVLAGGVLHQYDHATRQLVPVSDEEQFMFEKQRAAQWVALKWDVEEAGL